MQANTSVGTDFDVRVKDYPFDPRSLEPGIVRTRPGPSLDTPLYEVFIRLEGKDLFLVRGVTYFFNSTVSPPRQTVDRSDTNPDCTAAVWLWGKFDVVARIYDVKGREYSLRHYLEYDRYFDQDTFKKNGLSLRKA